MGEQNSGTVMVELNATAAQLLASMCVELGTDDATGVVSRSLGLLDLCLRTKRMGGRLMFENERGDISDVVF
jgi:hypothetical protein